MEIELAARARRIKPSPTLAITAKAQEMRAAGMDVLSLGAGEPDFDTPEHIKEAAVQAIHDGFTKYTPVAGTLSLRKAVAAKFKRDNNLDYAPNQIIVTAGGKQACYNLCQAVLSPGDEVIVPAPYWVSYPDMVMLADARPEFIATGPKTRYKITFQQLEAAITPRTRMIFLNSPSNPSGMAYTRKELETLGAILRRRQRIVIATDDMYEKILWTREPFVNILNVCPDLAERTVVIHAVSKTYAMTGWRIGYAAGPKKLIDVMTDIQSQSTSNANSIAQVAAEAALNGDQTCVKEMTAVFKRRHDRLVEGLNDIPGIRCLPGDGTFYAFPNMEGLMAKLRCSDDNALGEYLLREALVAAVPGSAFGTPGHLRLSFATSDVVLDECVQRLTRLAQS